jgi:NADH-quinone oxidoreductase subunit G
MIEIAPTMQQLDHVEPAPWGDFGVAGEMSAAPFEGAVRNFYLTDPITRASETMAQCSELFVDAKGEKTGTDG